MSPHEAWFGKTPAILHLRQFGCIVYAHIPHERTKKLDPRSKQCCLLGFVSTSIYRLYDPEANRIFTSRDVIFKENSFLPPNAFNIPNQQAKLEVSAPIIANLPQPQAPQSVSQ